LSNSFCIFVPQMLLHPFATLELFFLVWTFGACMGEIYKVESALVVSRTHGACAFCIVIQGGGGGERQ
jgi:hypothetical protein